MDSLRVSQIAQFAGASLSSGDGNVVINKVSTDSRTIKSGELFVALRGDNFDGHDFVEASAKAGATGALVDLNWAGDVPDDFVVLRATDTLRAYQMLAGNYRRSLALKVLAITGSNGKTSTKDFTASVLARRFRVTKTEGNFNNHVGLPRTILEASSRDQIAVWEIGMNHPGEIAALAKIAAPDAAIITNIGVAHIEFMGSREAIAQEKGTLAEAVGPGGVVILNADDPFTESIARRTRANIIFAGASSGALRAEQIRQTAEGAEFTAVEGAHRCRVQLPVPGLHMVQNAMLAIAAGRAFGMSLEDCARGLAGARLTKARLQMRTIRSVQFVDDSYNANPDSMKAALRTLVDLATDGRRIAVLGAMGELGTESERGHSEVGEAAAAAHIDHLITIGNEGAIISRAAKAAGLEHATNVTSAAEAADLLNEITSPGDLVLVKGSRTARMEAVLEEFENRTPAGVN